MAVEPLESLGDILADFEPGLAPAGNEQGEEELEWLNGDAFPPVETFLPADIPAEMPTTRPRSKILRRKRVVFSVPAGISAGGTEKRKCLHCESEETPQWREGPSGPKTLCNACGVRYKSGRLCPEYRPANSPSFSPALHSNSHRKIMEMRRRTASGSGTGRRGRPKLAVL